MYAETAGSAGIGGPGNIQGHLTLSTKANVAAPIEAERCTVFSVYSPEIRRNRVRREGRETRTHGVRAVSERAHARARAPDFSIFERIPIKRFA